VFPGTPEAFPANILWADLLSLLCFLEDLGESVLEGVRYLPLCVEYSARPEEPRHTTRHTRHEATCVWCLASCVFQRIVCYVIVRCLTQQ